MIQRQLCTNLRRTNTETKRQKQDQWKLEAGWVNPKRLYTMSTIQQELGRKVVLCVQLSASTTIHQVRCQPEEAVHQSFLFLLLLLPIFGTFFLIHSLWINANWSYWEENLSLSPSPTTNLTNPLPHTFWIKVICANVFFRHVPIFLIFLFLPLSFGTLFLIHSLSIQISWYH